MRRRASVVGVVWGEEKRGRVVREDGESEVVNGDVRVRGGAVYVERRVAAAR